MLSLAFWIETVNGLNCHLTAEFDKMFSDNNINCGCCQKVYSKSGLKLYEWDDAGQTRGFPVCCLAFFEFFY